MSASIQNVGTQGQHSSSLVGATSGLPTHEVGQGQGDDSTPWLCPTVASTPRVYCSSPWVPGYRLATKGEES